MITTGWPRWLGDYAGHFVAEMACALGDTGAPVHVLAPHGSSRHPNVHVQTYAGGPLLDGQGAPERLWSRPWSSVPAAGWASIQLARASLKYSAQCERIVAHWLVPSGVAAALAAERWGAPAHVYAHGSDMALLERLPVGRALARWIDGRVSSVICVSADLQQRWRALLGRAPRAACGVIPMGVTVGPRGDRDHVRRALGLGDGPVVATVGRHVPLKGLSVLIDALRDTDIGWLAIGDGPEKLALQRVAREADVDVRWVGQVTPVVRDTLLGAADVLAHPTVPSAGRSEGAPLAVMEALTLGLPVVASAVGGIPEWARHGVVTVPPDEPSALRQGLRSAMSVSVCPDPRWRWSEVIEQHRAMWLSAERPRR
ncbi:MAG: glycosyltransferase [Bradymonadia bacterium]